jgi:hypothetical protein
MSILTSVSGHDGDCRPRVPSTCPACILCDCEGTYYAEEGLICGPCLRACVTLSILVSRLILSLATKEAK